MKCSKIGVLLAALTIVAALGGVARASTITVKNNCGYQIAIGVWPPVWSNGGGFINSGASVSFGNWASGSSAPGGRIWSRHNCVANGSGPDTCASGQCGGSGIQCNGSTAAGVSEAEIQFAGNNNNDTYDASYVDGLNDVVSITPSNGGYIPSCATKPACSTFLGNGYGGSGDSCQSPCSAGIENIGPYNQNTDRWCCRNAFGTSASCNEGSWPAPESTYVNNIHSACNGSYGYAYDDVISTHTAPFGTNYTVTFCPNGGGSASSSSSSGGLSNGVHSLTPGNATGSRLDDSNGGTGNGNKIQIWQAATTPNQQWNFNNIGTNTWNMAVNLGPYCLRSSGTTSGSATEIWSCDGDAQESWVSGSASGGGFNFALKGFSLCLDVAGGLSANGTKVQVYTCNGSPSQNWTVN